MVPKERIAWIQRSVHEAIEKEFRRMKRTKDEDAAIIEENRLLRLMAEQGKQRPYGYASLMNDRYAMSWSGEDVIDAFRGMRISYQEKRAEVCAWAHDLVRRYEKALVSGAKADVEAYFAVKDKRILQRPGSDRLLGSQKRIAAMFLLARHPELYPAEDEEKLEKFGNVFAKSLLEDLSYILRNACDPARAAGRDGRRRREGSAVRLQQENAMLKSSLAQAEMLMRDLQEDFDDRLETSREQELVEFFSRLNSERYGCILDEILSLRRGIKQLRKAHCEVPVEVSGLFIFVEKLAQFVMDSHINPILPQGKVREVRSQDIEFCDYKGQPFQSDDEVKTVQVLSPGWIYEDKKLQISRPKVKEVQSDGE